LGRRWNVDPVVRPYESPYVCFRNNPNFYIDVNGANPEDPKEHTIVKGENLTKISKKYGVSIADLAKMNNIKDINKIKVGQVLRVNPEVEFSKSPLTNYNNPENEKYEEDKNLEHIADVAVNFVAGEGAENTIISGGNALKEVQSLPTIQSLINQGISALGKDGKFTPGEVFRSSYNIGNLKGENAKRIMQESILNFFNPFTFNPYNNAFYSAENVLGSYGFSMRVNADGKTITITVYDSKSIESITDRQTNATNQQRTAESSAMFSTTYQRYIWSTQIPGK
jgi:LysM repeat protein